MTLKFARTRVLKVLFTLGLVFTMPLSVLLILSAAVCSGVVAAAWFTILAGRAARRGAQPFREEPLGAPVPLRETVIETDAQPELAAKVG
jgi:hypothetical protein